MRRAAIRRRLKRATGQSVPTIFLAASLVIIASTVFAQDSRPPAGGAVHASVDPSTVAAPLYAAGLREATRLAQGGAVVQRSAGEQHRRWPGRHPVLFGTLLGTAGGAVASRTPAGGVHHDPRVVLIGTGIGAWAGSIASAVQKAHNKEPLSTGTKIGIVAGAISLIVLPLVGCYGAGGCGGVS